MKKEDAGYTRLFATPKDLQNHMDTYALSFPKEERPHVITGMYMVRNYYAEWIEQLTEGGKDAELVQ